MPSLEDEFSRPCVSAVCQVGLCPSQASNRHSGIYMACAKKEMPLITKQYWTVLIIRISIPMRDPNVN